MRKLIKRYNYYTITKWHIMFLVKYGAMIFFKAKMGKNKIKIDGNEFDT